MENRTNMNDLEQQIQKYYARQSLSPETLRTMLANAEQVRSSFWTQRWPVLVTASALALSVGATVCVFWFRQPTVTTLVAEEMAEHYVSNSENAQPVHYGSEERVQPQIPMPAFPQHPLLQQNVLQQNVLQQNVDIIREGNFAIRGNPATQVIMRERQSGSTFTLYVVPLSEELRHVKLGVVTRNGVAVKLWLDEEHLFGLAGEAQLQDQTSQPSPQNLPNR
jgi:hypothetical protein